MTQHMTNQRGEEIVTYTSKILAGRVPPAEGRRMDEPIALVTGASRRIGRAVALALARDGCGVVVHFHTREEAAEETRALIASANGQAVVRRFDVTK